jgi:hypothetical protein
VDPWDALKKILGIPDHTAGISRPRTNFSSDGSGGIAPQASSAASGGNYIAGTLPSDQSQWPSGENGSFSRREMLKDVPFNQPIAVSIQTPVTGTTATEYFTKANLITSNLDIDPSQRASAGTPRSTFMTTAEMVARREEFKNRGLYGEYPISSNVDAAELVKTLTTAGRSYRIIPRIVIEQGTQGQLLQVYFFPEGGQENRLAYKEHINSILIQKGVISK